MQDRITRRRRGTILPVLAITITGMTGFLALAIDLGMLAIGRTNCQNAADGGALAGARQLNNKDANNNRAAAESTAKAAIKDNSAINVTFTDSNISSVTIGVYDYNTTNQRFEVSYPTTLPTAKSWTAVKVSLTSSQPTFFAKIFGMNTMPTGADALAVHRPRDIALVLDYSGSMNFGSNIHWENGNGSSNGVVRGLLSADPDYPQFGHYGRYSVYNPNTMPTSGSTASATAGTVAPASRPHPLYNTQNFTMASGEVIASANITVETSSGPPMVMDFRFNPANIASPSTTTTSSATMWNAFHRWFTTTPTDTVDASLPEADQGNVFKYTGFKPNIQTTTTHSNHVVRTFDWSGYDPLDTTNTKGPTPAPSFFATQANSGSVNYAGDRWPRKNGVIRTTSTSWDQASTDGAAVNVIDFLAWRTAYNLLTPNRGAANSGSGSTLRNGLNLSPSTNNWQSNWSDFRDAAWERYGYDLDVADYVTNRPTSWDPRWDWNIDTAAWQHLRPTGTSPSVTFRPKRVLAADLFKGYSMGPSYWGKTFYIWPPDPRTPVNNPGQSGYVPGDWRRRFFYQGNSTETASTGRLDPQTTDNDASTTGSQNINQAIMTTTADQTLLDAANGSNRRYRVHYRNVLAWLKSGPQALPPNLRAGRILYYSSIPDNVDSASNNQDQRFWKEYIDFVLMQTADTNYDPNYNSAGVETVAWPEGASISIGATSGYAHGHSGVTPANDPLPFMNYSDNPSRPRCHFWFGPMTMIHFINSRSPRKYWTAGTVREAQMWQLKAAMNSALEDIRINHPNDACGMAYFAGGNYMTPRVSMGQDWTKLKNSLFYPNSMLTGTTPTINTITTETRMYNSSFSSTLVGDVPNANGSTDPVTGMAIAYNLLSMSTNLNSSTYATVGRRGASKIVIFETDGVPNNNQNWTVAGSGLNTYYQNSGSPTSWSSETRNGITLNTTGLNSQALTALNVVKQICSLENTGTGTGGLSTTNSPARVYAIGYGDLFQGYNGTLTSMGTQQARDALTFLLRAQQLGGTSDWSTTATFPTTNVITGSYATRIANMKDIMSRIMQSGVQVTLIE